MKKFFAWLRKLWQGEKISKAKKNRLNNMADMFCDVVSEATGKVYASRGIESKSMIIAGEQEKIVEDTLKIIKDGESSSAVYLAYAAEASKIFEETWCLFSENQKLVILMKLSQFGLRQVENA